MSKSNKEYSSRQEKMIADALGWNVRVGSGSRPCAVGDVYNDEWIGECKTHTRPDQRVTFLFSVWNKIKDEAASQFKFPVLFVDDGTQMLEDTWVLVNGRDYTKNLSLEEFKPNQKSISFQSPVMHGKFNAWEMDGIYINIINATLTSFEIFRHKFL